MNLKDFANGTKVRVTVEGTIDRNPHNPFGDYIVADSHAPGDYRSFLALSVVKNVEAIYEPRIGDVVRVPLNNGGTYIGLVTKTSRDKVKLNGDAWTLEAEAKAQQDRISSAQFLFRLEDAPAKIEEPELKAKTRFVWNLMDGEVRCVQGSTVLVLFDGAGLTNLFERDFFMRHARLIAPRYEPQVGDVVIDKTQNYVGIVSSVTGSIVRLNDCYNYNASALTLLAPASTIIKEG